MSAVTPPNKEYIFTFGFGHFDRETGAPLSKTFVRVPASSWEEARQIMVANCGRLWAFQYDSEDEAGVSKYGLTEVPLGTQATYGRSQP